jgi:hypothetical protein
MDSGNSKRMELALRRNRGREIVDEWTRTFTQICGIEVSESSFLPIEDTERLKSAFFDRIKNRTGTRTEYWDKLDTDELVALLHDLCIDVRSLPVVLFNEADQFIGGVRVPVDYVLRNAMAVWKIVGQDLSLVTEDLQNGLCLEENSIRPSGEFVKEGFYELTTWGLFERISRGKGKG